MTVEEALQDWGSPPGLLALLGVGEHFLGKKYKKQSPQSLTSEQEPLLLYKLN